MYQKLFFVLLIVFILLCCYYPVVDEFGTTSPGTLIQLLAKGPQDLYLTGWPNWMHPYRLHPWMPYWYFNHPHRYAFSPYWYGKYRGLPGHFNYRGRRRYFW